MSIPSRSYSCSDHPLIGPARASCFGPRRTKRRSSQPGRVPGRVARQRPELAIPAEPELERPGGSFLEQVFKPAVRTMEIHLLITCQDLPSDRFRIGKVTFSRSSLSLSDLILGSQKVTGKVLVIFVASAFEGERT